MEILKNKQTILLVFLFLLGFIIRLDFSMQMQGSSFMIGDAVRYNNMAENLLNGNGCINTSGGYTVRPPVYPIFLAVHYLLFGKNYFIIQITQILLNLLSIYLMLLIIKRYTESKFIIYGFLVLSMLYPFFIYWSRYLLTDINFLFLTSLFAYILCTYNNGSLIKPVIIGIIIGLTTLLRGPALFLPLVTFVYYGVNKDFKYAVKFSLIAGMVLSFFIISWGLYNYSKYKKFIPVASYGGITLYMANNPFACPDTMYYSTNKCYEEDFYNSLPETDFLKRDELCQARALQYIKKYPSKFILNNLLRIKLFFKEQRLGNILKWPVFKFLNPLIRVLDSLVLYFAAIGLIGCIRKFKKYLLFYLICLYYTFIYSFIPIVELVRFRLPIMLFLIFFAVKGMVLIYTFLSKFIKNKYGTVI